ncbi:MAG: hypothetical protein OXF41_20255 [bacterium]|nr:hypothetical protein [bacterium]
MIRVLGTVAVVWGLILATIGDDPVTGFTVAVVGWLIRRVTRPGVDRREHL